MDNATGFVRGSLLAVGFIHHFHHRSLPSHFHSELKTPVPEILNKPQTSAALTTAVARLTSRRSRTVYFCFLVLNCSSSLSSGLFFFR